MNKNGILFGIVGLIVGLIVGFSGANYLNRNAPANQPVANNQNIPPMQQQGNPPMQGQNPQGGMQADVQKTLDKAEQEPKNFEAQINAGMMYARIQNFEKALEFFQKAQLLKPDDFEANAMLGNAFLDARQFENAETYYAKALEINPKDVTIRSDLATTFLERNQPDYERAFAEFNKALELDPKHEATIYNMGIAYLKKGDKANAQKTVENLKTANPNSDLIAKFQKILEGK